MYNIFIQFNYACLRSFRTSNLGFYKTSINNLDDFSLLLTTSYKI